MLQKHNLSRLKYDLHNSVPEGSLLCANFFPLTGNYPRLNVHLILGLLKTLGSYSWTAECVTFWSNYVTPVTVKYVNAPEPEMEARLFVKKTSPHFSAKEKRNCDES
jgi:hypothetical protein